ncbi:beta-N-acetylhexosaminidase [Motilimonas pumila]|uniref:beta-N-acetylhexosaminidase n=1 Tax=Motilimonas pumila TaxID=2303987 RepID=A0A418YG70_9GAMM|nr:beta-N-acetylhexosaminidase [Motilimonas pumila]RJG48467.1 beta-hexosaminidase [Motilimonas pumila]
MLVCGFQPHFILVSVDSGISLDTLKAVKPIKQPIIRELAMALTLTITELNNLDSAYNICFELYNDSEQPLHNWRLHLSLVGLINASSCHGATFVRQDGSYLALQSQTGATLEAKQTLAFGFTGEKLAMKKVTDMPIGCYLSADNIEQPIMLELVPFTLPSIAVNPLLMPERNNDYLSDVAIIPRPADINLNQTPLKLPQQLLFDDNDFGHLATLFSAQLKQHDVSLASARSANIRLQLDPSLPCEAYRLCLDDVVVISASGEQGFAYGLTSLAQCLNSSTAQRKGVINDYPRFTYRGFMLDCVRHFRSVEKIKQLIDQLAYYKFNTLHWHLTDDEAWRLEIKAFPQLTKQTAFRGHDQAIEAQFGSGPAPYGGYYSQQDVKDVVSYAQQRQITIIPEIDIPGHCRAALKALPELLIEPADTSNYLSVQFYHDNVLNPALEGTYQFIDAVIQEVCALFPGPYVHVGADEVPKGVWQDSPACQEKMQAQGYQDIRELQGYLLRHVQDNLRQQGKTLLGWEEALDGDKLAQDAIICAWNGTQNGISAANKGYKVIMTPAHYTYLDMAYDNSESEPGTTWASALNLQQCYEYDVFDAELTATGKDNILGMQYAIWTEFINTDKQLDYMVFPRLLAGAENAWTGRSNKNWQGFVQRLYLQQDYLDWQGIQYRPL